MNPKFVLEKLAQVLVEIQELSGLDCPPITPNLKPVEALPKFDSKMWPVATGMLASAIGVSIPNDANIFRQPGTKLPLTIRESVAFVCGLIDKKSAAAE